MLSLPAFSRWVWLVLHCCSAVVKIKNLKKAFVRCKKMRIQRHGACWKRTNKNTRESKLCEPTWNPLSFAKGFCVISCMKIKYSVNFTSSSIEMHFNMKFARISFFLFIFLLKKSADVSPCEWQPICICWPTASSQHPTRWCYFYWFALALSLSLVMPPHRECTVASIYRLWVSDFTLKMPEFRIENEFNTMCSTGAAESQRQKCNSFYQSGLKRRLISFVHVSI